MSEKRTCSVEGCENSFYSKGFCSGHYRAWRRHGVAEPKGPKSYKPEPLCSVEDCQGPARNHGLCRKHHVRMIKYGDPTIIVRPVAEFGAGRRFLEEVCDNPPDGCAIWPYGKCKDGYGKANGFAINTDRAHAISRWLYSGERPNGRMACHHCDTPACVNPLHIYFGSAADNSRDCVERRRTNSKLDEVQVLRICEMEGSMTRASMASEFGVSVNTIQAVLSGANWGWLTGR